MTDRRLSRRDLLRLGLVAAPAGLLAGCGWDGGKLLGPALGRASRLNDWVGEKLFLSDGRLAKSYPRSARTPERDFPAYALSHPLPTPEDPEGWALEVGGLVAKPASLPLDMIQTLPRVTYTVKHHCVEGWTAIGT